MSNVGGDWSLLLSTLDISGAGTISTDTLSSLLQRLDPSFSDEEVRLVVKSVDPSGTGNVSLANLQQFLQNGCETNSKAESETVAWAFLVQNAGTPKVNGYYIRDAMINDAPSYKNEHGVTLFFWEDTGFQVYSAWFFSMEDQTGDSPIGPWTGNSIYKCLACPSAPKLPPCSGWVVDVDNALTIGQEPGPKIIAQAEEPARQEWDWGSREFVRSRMSVDYKWMEFQYADSSLKGDFDFAMEALRVNGANIQYLSDELRSNKEIGLEAMSRWCYGLQYLPPALRADRDVVLRAVEHCACGDVLAFADETMKADREVVLRAGISDTSSLQFAARSVMEDKSLILELLEKCSYGSSNIVFTYANPSMFSDRDFMLSSVQKSGDLLKHADQALKADRELVAAAIRNSSGAALDYADDALRSDRELVLEAISYHGQNLCYATHSLHLDRDIVLAAVRKGFSLANLKPCAANFLSDREIVLAAVTVSGSNLQFAIESLRADREVVLIAAKKDGFAVDFASAELKTDPELKGLYDNAVEEYERFMR